MSEGPVSNFDDVEQALNDPQFAQKYPGISGYAAHGGLIDAMRNLEQRLTRLEMLGALWLAPVQECVLGVEPFKTWLDHNWLTGSYAREYRHSLSNVRVTLPDIAAWDLQQRMQELLLTIAACVGRTPRDLLLEIQPDAFPSAVDALGALTRDG